MRDVKGPQDDVVLIVGATGTIGRALAEKLTESGTKVIGTSRQGADGLRRLDLREPPGRLQLPEGVRVVYLLAAETSMARCEEHPEQTQRVNVDHLLALADTFGKQGAHLVYVSSNLVLAGDKARASPSDPIAPQNVYARQKADVERRLLVGLHSASVLRVTKIAEGLRALIETWARSLTRHKPIAPYRDLVCAPMPLATAVHALMVLGQKRLQGLHQLSGDRDVSYAEIAFALALHIGADCSLVQPTTSEASNVRLVARPAHTTLDSTATETLLGLAPMQVSQALGAMFDTVTEDKDHPVR